MTDAAIAEDLGHDIEDVYAQRGREKALRENLRPAGPSVPGHHQSTADPNCRSQDPSGDSPHP